MLRALCCLALLAVLAAPARAQTDAAPRGASFGLSDSARVSLLTMMPGTDAYSLFGHSAIRIRDAAAGLDRTYNFGTFSFEQPFFVARFLGGSLDYQLATDPFEAVLASYQIQDRPIIEQTLALNAATVRALYALLETNALPENRDYRYDFFFDNCSTRLLDAIDAALAQTGAPAVSLPPLDAALTFRDLVEPYVQADPLIHLGTDLALALPADAVATPREQTFLPLELAAQLDRATVEGRPLVASRDTLWWDWGSGMRPASPSYPTWTAWLLFAAVAGASWRAVRRHKRLNGLDAVLFGTIGLAGTLLLLLWVATSHVVTGPNLILLWAWPTHGLAALAIALRWTGWPWTLHFAATAVVTGLVVVLWGVLPQEMHAALIPVALALALRGGLRAVEAWRPERASEPIAA